MSGNVLMITMTRQHCWHFYGEGPGVLDKARGNTVVLPHREEYSICNANSTPFEKH